VNALLFIIIYPFLTCYDKIQQNKKLNIKYQNYGIRLRLMNFLFLICHFDFYILIFNIFQNFIIL